MDRIDFVNGLPCLHPVSHWPKHSACSGSSPSSEWASLFLSVETSSPEREVGVGGTPVFLIGGDDPAEMMVDAAVLTAVHPLLSQSSHGSVRSPGSVSTSLSMTSPRPQIKHQRLDLWLRIGNASFKVDRSEIQAFCLEPSLAENETAPRSKARPASFVLDFGSVVFRFYYKDMTQPSFQRINALHQSVAHVVQGTMPDRPSPKNGSDGSSNSTSFAIFSAAETPSGTGQQLAQPDWKDLPSYERFRQLQRLLHQPLTIGTTERIVQQHLAHASQGVQYVTKNQAEEERQERLGRATQHHLQLEEILSGAFSSKHHVSGQKRPRGMKASMSLSVGGEDVFDAVKELIEAQKCVQNDVHSLCMFPTRS